MTGSSDLDVNDLELQVARARDGDRDALEAVVRALQPDVFRLAQRFLWHPQDAEDATQEILIRIITALGGFRAESQFRTWVYRIACNTLLTLRKQRMERNALSFDEFANDLAQGLSAEAFRVEHDVEHELLLEEVRIGCTLAMLQCLDRAQRMAYILGEVVELTHGEAAQVLDIGAAAFRKRLSRARARVTAFMTSNCGLVNASNPCRCSKRVAIAVQLGRVDPANLMFAHSLAEAKRFPELLARIRQLEETQRAAALYRSQPGEKASEAFVTWLRAVLQNYQAADS